VIEINREGLAWAAGFMDGEGNFRCKKSKYGTLSPIMQAAQIDPDVLYRLNRSLGNIGTVYGPYKLKTGKDVWSFHVGSFEKFQAASAMLWPFLSNIKRQQISSVLTDPRAGRPKPKTIRCVLSGHDVIWDLSRRNGNGYRQRRCRTCRRKPKP